MPFFALNNRKQIIDVKNEIRLSPIVLLCFLSIVANTCFAQQPKTQSSDHKTPDSVRWKALNERVLKSDLWYSDPDSAIVCGRTIIKESYSKSPKFLVKGYNILANTFNVLGQVDSALTYYKKMLPLAEKLGDKRLVLGNYINMTSAQLLVSDYTNADENIKKAKQLAVELKDSRGILMIYDLSGRLYEGLSNHSKAIENFFLELKMCERLNEKKSAALINIGMIYGAVGDKKKEIEYLEKGLAEAQKENNLANSANALDALGTIYFESKDYEKAKIKKETSLEAYLKLGDVLGEANTCLGLGAVLEAQGKYNDARKFYEQGLNLSVEHGSQDIEASAYNLLSSLFYKQGKYSRSLQMARKSMLLGNKSKNLKDQSESYLNLYNVYKVLRKPDSALHYYEECVSLEDSIFNDEKRKEVIQNSLSYEFSKHAFADSVKAAEAMHFEQIKHENEIRQEKIYEMAGLLSTLVMLVISGISWKAYRNKKRANILISTQKEIVESQKHIIEEKHKEITDSINYAERIQKSFLATKEILDANLNEYFVFFRPKDVVSGDFYWASKLNNNRFSLVTADSTGHGVPGAIMSLLNITSLEKAIEHHNEPSEILNSTRKTIIERLKKDGSIEGGKDGMDCSLLAFDFQSLSLTYSAANNPVWIVRNKEIIELAPDKMPVGKHDKDTVPFTQHEINLQKGDVVYALTDGMPDQFGGPKGKKFMYKPLKNLLISISDLPLQKQKQEIENTFNNWRGELEQVDDVTLIGIKI